MPVDAISFKTSGPGSEKRTRFFGFVGVWGAAGEGLGRVVVDVDEEVLFFAGLGLPGPVLALRLRLRDMEHPSSIFLLSVASIVCFAMVG